MATQYAGLPGNETRGATLTVSDATNATPIVVQTTAAHGLQTGERVVISGVQGNVAANGAFYVAVTAADAFALYDLWAGGAVAAPVAGSGAYTLGGSVQAQGWASTLQLPSDGDAINASSVNTATEGEGDREAWLIERTGGYRLVEFVEYGIVANPGSNTTTAPAGVQNLGEVTFLATDLDALYPLGINVIPGDVLEITATGAVFLEGNQEPMSLRLGIEIAEYGAAWTGTTTQSDLYSRQTMGRDDTGALVGPPIRQTYFPYCLRARITPSISHGCVVKPRMYSEAASIPARTSFVQRGSFAYRVQVWRINA